MTNNYNYRDKDGNPAPKFLMVNGCQVWNPTEQMYADAGYLPYTPPTPSAEEVAEMERVAEIERLKEQLAATDYKAIKHAEGWLTTEEYAPTKAQRQQWRERINELEGGGDR